MTTTNVNMKPRSPEEMFERMQGLAYDSWEYLRSAQRAVDEERRKAYNRNARELLGEAFVLWWALGLDMTKFLPLLTDWEKQWDAERAKRRCPVCDNIYTPTPLPKGQALAQLRLAVLERSLKRRPKWRFRLPSHPEVPDRDHLVEIQPQVAAHGHQTLFLGKLIERADLAASAFTGRDQRRGAFSLSFRILETPTGEWQFELAGYGWPAQEGRRAAAFFVQRARESVAWLVQQDSLSPEQLLAPACMVCGRGLTDPASQARLIGPECAGTASLTVPWIRRLLEQTDSSAA